MADFTTVLSDQAVMDNSQIEAWQDGVIIAAQEDLIIPQFVSQVKKGQAKTQTFIKYAHLSGGTTALVDGEDVTSEAMSDSEVQLTPVEQGNAVSTTKLANLSSGGRVDTGSVKLVGSNMGQSIDKLGIRVLEAGTNELIVTQDTEAELTASDVLTEAYFNAVYNKLRRQSIPKIAGQHYAAVLHPDVAEDIKDNSSAGSWMDVNKYSGGGVEIFNNEIGIYRGFRIIENANITINEDAGASAVDTYHSLFLGYNALGYAESEAPHGVISGPFDKLKRIVNTGWYGVFKYGIIDQNALWKVTSASSYGSNT